VDPPRRRARRTPVTEAHPAAAATRRHPLVQALARAGFAANGLVHALIGTLVVAIAAGGRGEADQVGALRTVAAVPWGAVLVWAIAIGLWGLALWHLAAGITARGDGRWGGRAWSLRKGLAAPPSGPRLVGPPPGVAGFMARGAALGILGVLLLVAAAHADAARAGGLDSAVDGLLTLPAGRAIAVTLGIGLVAYGVFCGFRARYARL